jgi:hypothetical protein
MPAKGTTCLYRPVPADFDETFIRVGWTSICEELNAGWVTVTKWMKIRNGERVKAGGSTLSQARAAYVAKHGPAKSPARYDYQLRTVRKRHRLRSVTDQQAEG